MKAELNLLALAMTLNDVDVDVDPDDFSNPWTARAWEQLQRGDSYTDVYEVLDMGAVKLLSDTMASLPAIVRRADLVSMAAHIREASVDRQIRTIAERHKGYGLVTALSNAVLGGRMDANEKEVPHVREIVAGLLARAEAVYNGEEPETGIPTGLSHLDARLTFGGLKRGAVTVLAGASSAGKSALAKTCILGGIAAGKKVYWGSYEDSKEAATTRMLSDLSGIENRQLQRSIVGLNEWKKLHAAAGTVGDSDVWVDDQPPPSIDALIRKIRRQVTRFEIDLVVIDFLQLLTLGGKAESKTVEVTKMAQAIQVMSRQLPDTATLLVSQCRRTGNSCPTKEDLRWSGEIEQLAHTIGLLWKPELEGYNMIALNLAKQKDGPTGLLALGWKPETVSYSVPLEGDADEYLDAANKLGRQR